MRAIPLSNSLFHFLKINIRRQLWRYVVMIRSATKGPHCLPLYIEHWYLHYMHVFCVFINCVYELWFIYLTLILKFYFFLTFFDRFCVEFLIISKCIYCSYIFYYFLQFCAICIVIDLDFSFRTAHDNSDVMKPSNDERLKGLRNRYSCFSCGHVDTIW